MIEAIRKIFAISELKKKVWFTLALLALCRIGAFVPVPGINGDEATKIFQNVTGGGQNLFQFLSMFTGGAFTQMTVAALGVMPYITASIIMQLLTAIFPGLQREIRENPEQGRRKLAKWTRYLTVGLAFFQSSLFARYIFSINRSSPGLIAPEILDVTILGMPWLYFLLFMATMTTGTMLLMWVGEQITEKGVGNGVSLIITLGILSSIPTTIGSMLSGLNLDSQEIGQLTFSSLFVLIALFVIIIIATILIIQGQRKIPLQYARRVVGRHEVQGSSAYIPLKVNYAGVIPVIFASALLMFPATIAQFVGHIGILGAIARALTPGSTFYNIFYVFLIICFTYFWTATQFHPEQIASDMKKNGAFIPGIRQGRPTQEFLEFTMNRITFAGALCLAIIAILPTLVSRLLGVNATISHFFGGTSLLILVGVVLDTTKQIESHLLMKRYDGFIKRGRKRTI